MQKKCGGYFATYIQHCNNARFIFAGSQRHTMGNIFQSPARPFYQSVSMMHLDSIPLGKYTAFAEYHFGRGNRVILPEVVTFIYKSVRGNHVVYAEDVARVI